MHRDVLPWASHDSLQILKADPQGREWWWEAGGAYFPVAQGGMGNVEASMALFFLNLWLLLGACFGCQHPLCQCSDRMAFICQESEVTYVPRDIPRNSTELWVKKEKQTKNSQVNSSFCSCLSGSASHLIGPVNIFNVFVWGGSFWGLMILPEHCSPWSSFPWYFAAAEQR